MKKIVLGIAAAGLMAVPAFADGLIVPEEEIMVAEPTKSSSAGWVLPVLGLILVAAIISGDDSDPAAPADVGEGDGLAVQQ